MTNAGCQLNCSNDNEQNLNRWECECVSGYFRDSTGLCVRDCNVYGDVFLFTCEDNENECCCPVDYTYNVEEISGISFP